MWLEWPGEPGDYISSGRPNDLRYFKTIGPLRVEKGLYVRVEDQKLVESGS